MPADPPNYDTVGSGPCDDGSIASMGEERDYLIDYDAFEWVDLPENTQSKSIETRNVTPLLEIR